MKNVQLSDKIGQISLDYTFQSCSELESVQILDLPLKRTYIKRTRRFGLTTICWTAQLTNRSKLAAGVRKTSSVFFSRRVYSFVSYLFISLSSLCTLEREELGAKKKNNCDVVIKTFRRKPESGARTAQQRLNKGQRQLSGRIALSFILSLLSLVHGASVKQSEPLPASHGLHGSDSESMRPFPV